MVNFGEYFLCAVMECVTSSNKKISVSLKLFHFKSTE